MIKNRQRGNITRFRNLHLITSRSDSCKCPEWGDEDQGQSLVDEDPSPSVLREICGEHAKVESLKLSRRKQPNFRACDAVKGET